MVSACLEAYRATDDSFWYEHAQRAFDWFLGWNDLGLELYSANTGGCRDALHVDRVNRNQGAESSNVEARSRNSAFKNDVCEREVAAMRDGQRDIFHAQPVGDLARNARQA